MEFLKSFDINGEKDEYGGTEVREIVVYFPFFLIPTTMDPFFRVLLENPSSSLKGDHYVFVCS